MATVRLIRGAEEDVAKVDGSHKTAIANALIKLSNNPGLRGEPLARSLHGYRKLVIGSKNFRIVYRYFEDLDLVWVIAIGARKELNVYKIAESRINDLDWGSVN